MYGSRLIIIYGPAAYSSGGRFVYPGYTYVREQHRPRLDDKRFRHANSVPTSRCVITRAMCHDIFIMTAQPTLPRYVYRDARYQSRDFGRDPTCRRAHVETTNWETIELNTLRDARDFLYSIFFPYKIYSLDFFFSYKSQTFFRVNKSKLYRSCYLKNINFFRYSTCIILFKLFSTPVFWRFFNFCALTFVGSGFRPFNIR